MPSTSLMTLAGQYPKPFSFAYTRSWGGFCKHSPHPCVVRFTQARLSGALSWLGPEELNFQPHAPATHPWFDTDVLKLCSMHHQADQHYTLETRQIYCFFSLHKFGNVQTLPIVSLFPRKEKYLSGRYSPPPPPPPKKKPAGKNGCVRSMCVHACKCLSASLWYINREEVIGQNKVCVFNSQIHRVCIYSHNPMFKGRRLSWRSPRSRTWDGN